MSTYRRTNPKPPGLDPRPVLAAIGRMPSTAAALRLGVADSTVRRWRAGERGISLETADRIALALGMHPANLWPEAWR